MEESNGSTQSTEAVAITLPGLRLFVHVYFNIAYLYISHSKFFSSTPYSFDSPQHVK